VTIQVGSFIEKSRAFRLKQGLAFKYDNVYVSSSYIKGTKYYRVRVGKYSNYDTAYSIAKKLAEEGYSTFITSK
jgi:rare lipoprotein A